MRTVRGERGRAASEERDILLQKLEVCAVRAQPEKLVQELVTATVVIGLLRVGQENLERSWRLLEKGGDVIGVGRYLTRARLLLDPCKEGVGVRSGDTRDWTRLNSGGSDDSIIRRSLMDVDDGRL